MFYYLRPLGPRGRRRWSPKPQSPHPPRWPPPQGKSSPSFRGVPASSSGCPPLCTHREQRLNDQDRTHIAFSPNSARLARQRRREVRQLTMLPDPFPESRGLSCTLRLAQWGNKSCKVGDSFATAPHYWRLIRLTGPSKRCDSSAPSS